MRDRMCRSRDTTSWQSSSQGAPRTGSRWFGCDTVTRRRWWRVCRKGSRVDTCQKVKKVTEKCYISVSQFSSSAHSCLTFSTFWCVSVCLGCPDERGSREWQFRCQLTVYSNTRSETRLLRNQKLTSDRSTWQSACRRRQCQWSLRLTTASPTVPLCASSPAQSYWKRWSRMDLRHSPRTSFHGPSSLWPRCSSLGALVLRDGDVLFLWEMWKRHEIGFWKWQGNKWILLLQTLTRTPWHWAFQCCKSQQFDWSSYWVVWLVPHHESPQCSEDGWECHRACRSDSSFKNRRNARERKWETTNKYDWKVQNLLFGTIPKSEGMNWLRGGKKLKENMVV